MSGFGHGGTRALGRRACSALHARARFALPAGSPLPAVEIVVVDAAVVVGAGRGSRRGATGSPSPAVEVAEVDAAAPAAVGGGSGRGTCRGRGWSAGFSPGRAATGGAAISSGGAAGGRGAGGIASTSAGATGAGAPSPAGRCSFNE